MDTQYKEYLIETIDQMSTKQSDREDYLAAFFMVLAVVAFAVLAYVIG